MERHFSSTLSRNRTGTSVTSQVFETSASTNSAIRACIYCFIHFEGAKIGKIIDVAIS